MDCRIYLYDLYPTVTEIQKKYVAENPYYDLSPIQSEVMREEITAFIKYRATQVSLGTLYGERRYYKQLCCFLQKRINRVRSFCDKDAEVWLRQFKGWMLEKGISLTYEDHGDYGSVCMVQSKLISIWSGCWNLQVG